MTAKLFIKTHGCQMNEYDSDRMADLLKDSHALTATDVPDDAEVILINTCSIREKAQEKVFSESGNYTLTIQQAMRKNGSVEGIKELKGLTDVGLRIEKTQ